MKLIKKTLISLACILSLTSCGDGLNKFRRNGQYVELTYEVLDQKTMSDESFVFFVSRKGCQACEEFYSVVGEFLKENEDKVIYQVNASNLLPLEEGTIATYFSEILGEKYFKENDKVSNVLYTPSICKVVDGEVVYGQIGNIDKETLSSMYQDNYLSFNTFYMLNKKAQRKDTFNILVSTVDEGQYDQELREYFVNNPNLSGYYLNAKDFDEEDNKKLIGRINYYLGEGNEIQDLPDYFLLQYEEGILVNYSDVKYDEAMLNALYNK